MDYKVIIWAVTYTIIGIIATTIISFYDGYCSRSDVITDSDRKFSALGIILWPIILAIFIFIGFYRIFELFSKAPKSLGARLGRECARRKKLKEDLQK